MAAMTQSLSRAFVNCPVMVVREKIKAGQLGKRVGRNIPMVKKLNMKVKSSIGNNY